MCQGPFPSRHRFLARVSSAHNVALIPSIGCLSPPPNRWGEPGENDRAQKSRVVDTVLPSGQCRYTIQYYAGPRVLVSGQSLPACKCRPGVPASEWFQPPHDGRCRCAKVGPVSPPVCQRSTSMCHRPVYDLADVLSEILPARVARSSIQVPLIFRPLRHAAENRSSCRQCRRRGDRNIVSTRGHDSRSSQLPPERGTRKTFARSGWALCPFVVMEDIG